jgi:hypothetical protein
MSNETDHTGTLRSHLDSLPPSPLGTLVVFDGKKRQSSNDDEGPKIKQVNTPQDPPREGFDPRSNAWAFEGWDG